MNVKPRGWILFVLSVASCRPMAEEESTTPMTVELVGQSSEVVSLLANLGRVMDLTLSQDLPACADVDRWVSTPPESLQNFDPLWDMWRLESVIGDWPSKAKLDAAFPAGCELAAGLAVRGQLSVGLVRSAESTDQLFPSEDDFTAESVNFGLELENWLVRGQASLDQAQAYRVNASFDLMTANDTPAQLSFAGCIALDDQEPAIIAVNGDLNARFPAPRQIHLNDVQQRNCDPYPFWGEIETTSKESPITMTFSPDTPLDGQVTVATTTDVVTVALPIENPSACSAAPAEDGRIAESHCQPKDE